MSTAKPSPRMSPEECWTFVSEAHTGIFTTLRRDGTPIALPMWFACLDRTLYLQSRGRKLERIRHNPRASFLVESGEHWADLKAVHLTGTAELVDLDEDTTRRFRQDPRGARIDLRRTLRQSLRGGGSSIDIARRHQIRRHPPLVILCDISGSMSRYSRMLLQFMHAVTNDRDRVHSFLFGTRLTNVSRYLRFRDIDVALEKVGNAVLDWSGGTRIGHALEEFNRVWSRRVLGQGAVVILITDGLDRDAGLGLAGQMERLHKSCRRLIWLNPLLRFDAYAPISTGAKAMIRHVDDFRTVHNLASLRDLTDVLSRAGLRRAEGLTEWIAASRGGHAA